jgi:PTH2 family peptidyl-tRNA hydrolase
METKLLFIACCVTGFILGWLSRSLWQNKTKKTGGEKLLQKAVANNNLDDEYKLVLVVRGDLKMQPGKVAAQCSHATLGAYKRVLKRDPETIEKWTNGGQAKVVVKVKTEQELNEIEEKAKQAGITTYLVLDAGRTQVAAGSKTVLAVGPGTHTVLSLLRSAHPT